jgi:Protein of unknown function (DUF3485)
MMNSIRILAAASLIVGAGIVHGAWINRWGPSPALSALGARFESVPMEIGDWKGTPFELPPAERSMAGAVACLARRYVNPIRGASVTVVLLGGLPGRMSVHTPDVCYTGAGYTLESPTPFERRYGIDDRHAAFQTSLAARGGPNPSVLRIIWSWNASKGWATPAVPRWEYVNAPALCKLYVIRETSGSAADPATDPCNDFLTVLLPELDKYVFAARK